MVRKSELIKFKAEMLKEEVEARLLCEAEITTLREDIIEITADMGDNEFSYETLRKIEGIAEEYGCDMNFYVGAEKDSLILLLYFYPGDEEVMEE